MSRSGKSQESKGGAPSRRSESVKDDHSRQQVGIKPSRLAAILSIGSNRPVLRAVIIFIVLMGLFYGFIHTPAGADDPFLPYLKVIAKLTAGTLRLIGYDATAEGTLVAAPEFSVSIVRGCDAIEPVAAFIAAVLASPVAFPLKIPGILIGIAALLVINLVRIFSLFLVGLYWPKAFDLVHLDVWQAVFIVLAIVFWAVWVQWATRDRTERVDEPA